MPGERAGAGPETRPGLAQVLDDGAAVELAAARWAVLDHRGRVPELGLVTVAARAMVESITGARAPASGRSWARPGA